MGHPFFGKKFLFTQPNGYQFQVTGWGNDSYALFETEDGYTIFQNPESRMFSYAALDTKTGQLVATKYIVGIADPEALVLERHVRESNRIVTRKQKQRSDNDSLWRRRRNRAKSLEGPTPFSTSDPTIGFSSGQIVGDIVGLCIPVEFQDESANFEKLEIENFCNQIGYNKFGNSGSVRDYFLDVSLNKFNYTNLVTPVYRAKKTKEYYTNPLIPKKKRTIELIEEALAYFIDLGFDFSSLTVDDNNAIYALNVFYSGAVENNFDEGLWPHQFHLSNPIDIGSGYVVDYQITNMGEELVIGTFCHETGHLLCRFPDLYDTNFKSAGTGVYCLMGLGGIIDERNCLLYTSPSPRD